MTGAELSQISLRESTSLGAYGEANTFDPMILGTSEPITHRVAIVK
jgi:hypothetical protein